jgi:N-acetylneuraminic acid mutarotase
VSGGKVLVVGDDNFAAPGPPSAMGAEIWDPATSKWTATGSLPGPREYFAAQSLANGKALVFGGEDDNYISLGTAYIYDPATGKWTWAGTMNTEPMSPASTRLKDGRVMSIGGEYVDAKATIPMSSAEIWDGSTNKWIATGSLHSARIGGQAVTLTDGRVLVVGGTDGNNSLKTAEIWTPGTGQWTVIGNLNVSRAEFTLVALSDGSALVAGGLDTTTTPEVAVASAERLNMTTLKWTPIAAMKSAGASRISAVMADGKVLVAGGRSGAHSPAITGAEIFDPTAGTWTATAAMTTTQERSGAVLLSDGSIFVAGGDGGFTGPGSTPWIPDARLTSVRYYPAKP